MSKAIHENLISTLIISAIMPFLATASVYADDSFTVSTPLLPNVTDYNVDGDVTLDVNVAEINALEITLSTSNLAIDLTPKIGIPSFDTDTLVILVGTTNITGYTLTMASSYNGNSTTSLTRAESISSTVPTIDTIGSTVAPDVFASTSDTSSINKWGYLLSATNLDVNKTVYNPVLSSNTVNSSTEAVYNDPTTITFGAKVDSDLPAGNYKATLKFMAVVNPVGYNYNITLNGNGGTIAGNETTTLTGLDASVALPTAETTLYRTASTTNTSTRYATLAGWSETPDASTPTYTDALALTEDTDTTLYAVWNFNSGTLQNPSSTCSNNMIDARTGASYLTYTISGDCYMEQNLYLPLGQTLYAGDSNINGSSFAITKDLTLGDSYTEARLHEGIHTNNTYNAQGSWFNYCAASAGTVCSDTVKADAVQDVCPKGWRLPNDTQLTTIMNAARNNWKFYTGYYRDGRLTSAQAAANWWGLIANSQDAAMQQRVAYNSQGQFVVGDDWRKDGISIRCVRK